MTNSNGIAHAETTSMTRSVFSRPTWSDIHPENTRPDALPTAPIVSANAATAWLWPDARANGINWLMTIVPAVVPMTYASQSSQNVGVRTIADARTSTPGRDAARTFDGSHPAGT